MHIKSNFFSFQAYNMGSAIEFLRVMMILSSGYVVTFIFCYFGQKVTSAYEMIHDSMYLSDWNSYSMEIRKYMPIMLMLAKKPVWMQGFANSHCTLKTFQKVKQYHRILLSCYKQILCYFRWSTPLINVLLFWRRYSDHMWKAKPFRYFINLHQHNVH